jgi:hypothetical protein
MLSTDEHYVRRLDSWVKGRWRAGEETWEQFLLRLPGFYPLDVWRALDRLNLPAENLRRDAEGQPRNENSDAFPDISEHPLDYEWRFTARSVERILFKLDDLIRDVKRPSVACFGCPSIAVAGDNYRPEWDWSLLDRRAASIATRVSRVSLHPCDLTVDRPEIAACDAAVVDPPWYMPITKHFLTRAQAATKVDGVILLSFPPEGTRPGIKEELAELLEWCNAGGLEPQQINYGLLTYKTPFFESNSLNAAGFTARVPAWRRAELIAFINRAAPETGLQYNDSMPSRFSGQWRWFSRDGLKICVSNSAMDIGNCPSGAGLRPVWSEAILPTVSTTLKGRESANFVTSSNRFFQCADHRSAIRLLEGWAKHGTISDNIDGDGLLAEQIRATIASELEEREAYLRYIHD